MSDLLQYLNLVHEVVDLRFATIQVQPSRSQTCLSESSNSSELLGVAIPIPTYSRNFASVKDRF